jgi:hypothetical protein
MSNRILIEWAHKDCHPETCCHPNNYKVFLDKNLIGWTSTRKEASDYAERAIRLKRLEKWLEHKF